ncbi:antibiotic biosynthesis monooxygenase [Pedobacter sp. HMWF019]|uniref:antibiotic biosynthesis monooxygenase family protein n=1 Tax=Pedobacter sp. HMWF019 TaxID=2056856 RepID=UPI000D368760|nr:antibiotic biosynthesis monooxygenase [Pedobacter sp. HMWF019]PTS94115.1 antibiotic biosynthesis monooxygenase [Pedobacter sp. HMWF019]
MILEIAILHIIQGKTAEFELAFAKAQEIISSMEGYLGHELQKCIEHNHQYILLVKWDTLENHTIGFRNSSEYQEWKVLLHHFYHPFPIVEHYQIV